MPPPSPLDTCMPVTPQLGSKVGAGGLKVPGHPWLPGFRASLAFMRQIFKKNPRKEPGVFAAPVSVRSSV